MKNTFLDSSDSSVLAALRGDRPVVIFGAGPLGSLTLNAARRLGITISAYCDNNPSLAGTQRDGVPIVSPDTAARRYPDAFYFIAMYAFLSALPELQKRHLGGRCLTLDLIKLVNPSLAGIKKSTALILEQTCYSQKSMVGDGGIYLGKLILTVTDYCSLRCRDCMNRIPYIAHPKHRDKGEAIASLDALLEYIDGIQELHLIGGDAMMHPELPQLAAEALARDKIRRVGVYTNAVVPFKAELWRSLPADRLTFHVTDYGLPQQHINDFAMALDKAGMSLCLIEKEVWQRFAIKYQPECDTPECRRRFIKCRPSVCTNINNGRLYRCQLAPNAIREGLIPDDPDNYVDLASESKVLTRAEIRRRLEEFLYEKEEMAACAFCTAMTPGVSPEVKPAIQLA